MKRQGPTAFEIPEDLWEDFENKAPSSGPLPHLRLLAEDLMTRPQALEKTLGKLLKKNSARSPNTVVKGVRWPKELWDQINHVASVLHTTKVGVLRLIMEHDLD